MVFKNFLIKKTKINKPQSKKMKFLFTFFIFQGYVFPQSEGGRLSKSSPVTYTPPTFPAFYIDSNKDPGCFLYKGMANYCQKAFFNGKSLKHYLGMYEKYKNCGRKIRMAIIMQIEKFDECLKLGYICYP